MSNVKRGNTVKAEDVTHDCFPATSCYTILSDCSHMSKPASKKKIRTTEFRV